MRKRKGRKRERRRMKEGEPSALLSAYQKKREEGEKVRDESAYVLVCNCMYRLKNENTKKV